MSQIDLQKILNQIEEIQALFVFVQRVIPYLEEIIRFVQETTPLMEEVSQSILESSKKMPTAVAELDKVSSTTESAASDMLDGIERMLDTINNSISLIDQINEFEKERLMKEKALVLKLAETLDGIEETQAANVKQALDDFYEEYLAKNCLQKLRQNIFCLQNDAYEIMNSLQIQDITTQQIMAANDLIESVQSKLVALTNRLSFLFSASFNVDSSQVKIPASMSFNTMHSIQDINNDAPGKTVETHDSEVSTNEHPNVDKIIKPAENSTCPVIVTKEKQRTNDVNIEQDHFLQE
ncbi:MAG: hypothetical protein Q9P90_00070 [candidate division KSB1 bacterium]|nr:hypothetical protein [candidate division KSB1 bacterium]